jgi:hypothetical protein
VGSLPEWFDGRKQQNARSKKQENDRARQLGGRRQPGSGSSRRAPQDVKTDKLLEQVKYSDKDRITIKVADAIQTLNDALLFGREAGWCVDFENHGIRLIIQIERTTKK